jgi:hypothetical protein
MKSPVSFAPVLAVSVLAVCGADLLMAASIGSLHPGDLTAHEWGTFTSIAGDDGMAIDWEPLDGPSDLPCFVHRFEVGSKALLSGTVRMETPVIYLYGPKGSTASVRVSFPNGFITEWYPKANRVATFIGSGIPPRGPDVRQPGKDEPDSIEWPAVKLQRDSDSIDFPLEQPPSHYYAGRRTDSDALLVGDEMEKFLFYRGVGRFQPPLAAIAGADDRIVVRELGPAQIPAAILFQNHDGNISYRVSGPIGSEVTLELPQAAANTGMLRAEMERILTSQGLFAKEAKAMVATWGDSWFEEGTRLFYFLPPGVVDSLLPLEIRPVPPHVARVFVGRMEIFTPAMKRSIRDAITRQDSRVFAKYGRFLNAVTAGMAPDAWRSTQASVMRQKYLGRETSCGKSTW